MRRRLDFNMDGRRDLTLLLPIDLIITLKSQQLFRLMSEDFVGGVYAHIYNTEQNRTISYNVKDSI